MVNPPTRRPPPVMVICFATSSRASAALSSARAPMWERFLERVLPDAAVRAFVQRYLGYAITGDVREQVLVFAYGTSPCGPSVAPVQGLPGP